MYLAGEIIESVFRSRLLSPRHELSLQMGPRARDRYALPAIEVPGRRRLLCRRCNADGGDGGIVARALLLLDRRRDRLRYLESRPAMGDGSLDAGRSPLSFHIPEPHELRGVRLRAVYESHVGEVADSANLAGPGRSCVHFSRGSLICLNCRAAS